MKRRPVSPSMLVCSFLASFLLTAAVTAGTGDRSHKTSPSLAGTDPVALREDTMQPTDDPDPIGDSVALVPKIGSIMRAKKPENAEWEKAAKLQDLWLGYSKHVATPQAPENFDYTVVTAPDKTGITMDWILKETVGVDGRAQSAFMQLQALIAGAGDEIKTAIKQKVNAKFASTAANTVPLGDIKLDPSGDVKAFHSQRVIANAVKSDYLLTPIDPLLGALGSFNFYAVPVGKARRQADGLVKVDIDKFLIYVLDSFDFNGEQPLGYFKEPNVISKNPLDGTLMANLSYRVFRTEQNKGGDFLVLSDIREANIPVSFTFMPDSTFNGTWTSADAKQRFELAINGTAVQWREIGVESGLTITRSLTAKKVGDALRIERPNNDNEVLTMLGFSSATLRQSILNAGPQASVLTLKQQGGLLSAQWRGLRVKKTPQGGFQSLVQPEDPGNTPVDYVLKPMKP